MNAEAILRLLMPIIASLAKTSGNPDQQAGLAAIMALVGQQDASDKPDPTPDEVKSVQDQVDSIYDRIANA